MADLEQTGLEFVAEGVDAFESAVDEASGAINAFEESGASAAESFNPFEEIVTGALRKVGEVALDFAMNAGGAILDFAQDAFTGALDAEKGLIRLRGAITRAGDAAPITEQQALDLADSLKFLAGGSDDAVIAAEAVLLKFQSIGKETFPDALQVSADLAAILGTDMASAAEQLGRALGNPEQASRILRQAGVFLTDQEKEQIKVWMESGDQASAQAFLLDKLATATKGAAEQMAGTVGGQMAIFQETIADAGEQIATAFLPILQTLMDNYLKPLLPIIGQVADFIAAQITPAFGDFGGSLTEVEILLQPIIDALADMFTTFQEHAPEMQAIGKELFSFLADEFGLTLPNLIDNVASIIRSLTRIWDEHGDTIMGIVTFAFKIIVATIMGAMTLVSGIIDVALKIISGSFDFWSAIFEGRWEDAWNILLDTVEAVTDTIMATLGTFIGNATSIVTEGMSRAFNDWVMAFTAPLQDAIIQAGRTILEGFGMFYEAGVSLMDGLRRGIYAGIGWITDAISGTVQQAINNAMSILQIHSPSKLTMDLIGEPIGLGVAEGIMQAVGQVKTSMEMLVSPAMTPSQYVGATNNSSYVNSPNYNLNVSSTQGSQGIVSDFGIMQAMAS